MFKDLFDLFCSVDNQIQRCDIIVIENDCDEEITVKFKMNDFVVSQQDETCFGALIKLRIELEKQNIKLFCKGCKENVYPSPMMMSMGRGDIAYELTFGQQARRSDIVNIFDKCDSNEYATVEEQKSFYNNWLDSF